MARPQRIHFEGALFHITARGNDRQQTFRVDRDFQRYLQTIETCKKNLPFTLYAFALMPNHVHLLIEVGKYGIDKVMHRIQTAYTMYFNKKHGHTGHVFEGRYHWFLVDKDSYLLELIRYIHLNPVRAGLVDDPKNYLWSSHGVYLNDRHAQVSLLAREAALALFSSNPDKQVTAYQEFIFGGIGSQWDDVLPKPTWGHVVGTEKFMEKIERKVRKMMRSGA